MGPNLSLSLAAVVVVSCQEDAPGRTEDNDDNDDGVSGGKKRSKVYSLT